MSEPSTTILGTALIGGALTIVEDAAVVIEGHRIAAAGPRADTPVPPGSTVVVAGGVVMPGFIDAHVHIAFYDPAEIVAGGVTTVRDLAWPPDEIFPLAEASRAHDFAGPTIHSVGRMLTAPGGYPTKAAWAPPGTGLEIVSPAVADDAVAKVAASGACAVKVALNPPAGPVLDRPTLAAIVDAAHARALGVTAHVHGLSELDKALDCGIDELAHMLMSPETIPEETLARMVQQEMAVVPTLSVRSDDLDVAVDNLERFLGLGGRVVYGTDLGNQGPRPGIDPKEVAAMAAAGMSGLDVIRSATTDGAHHLGLPDAGRIEPGAVADLVATDRDPLADPLELTRVSMVYRRGRRIR